MSFSAYAIYIEVEFGNKKLNLSREIHLFHIIHSETGAAIWTLAIIKWIFVLDFENKTLVCQEQLGKALCFNSKNNSSIEYLEKGERC